MGEVGVLSSARNYRYIVRIAGTDIDGSLKTVYGLAEIKGVGVNLAYGICRRLGIDPEMRIGYLTDEEIKRIEDLLSNPSAYDIPSWMLNRRKDYVTGKDMHLIGAELIFYVKQDIEREKKIKSWRGIRHALGLKVRGQRTRTTGRLGLTVGVRRKRR
ncbi:ribosomal protein S13P [Staphylothermus hellenicus DSM 12710]|uniref:Small ribosomal subunit protein uS13 n=1 Tax=Staphylothermus hellenicus (strain DSM 12710 / JCM 10830 / BK20S6-10-b1 / P8) TaxID=591019 RepID=D7DAE4_STAHD|nr:ribosomal protein S13P [Staphylothermus hellenicus DSM 12710]